MGKRKKRKRKRREGRNRRRRRMAEFRVVPKGIKPVNAATAAKFLDNLSGRDKTLRFVQYFSRFAMYQLLQQDPKSELGARLKLLYKGLGTHRKAFKLGKSLDEYNKFMKILEAGKFDLKAQLGMVLRVFMGVFVFLDNLVWATSLKIIKLDKDPLKKKAYQLRLVAAALNLTIASMDFMKQSKVVAKLDKDSADRVKAEEKQGS